MKRLMVSLLLVSGLTSGAVAAELKIGVVNMQTALTQSKGGIENTAKLKAFYEEKMTVLKQKDEEIKKVDQEYKSKATILNDENKKKYEKRLGQMVDELRRLSKESDDEFREMEAKLTDEVLKALNKVVAEIGKAEKFDLLLESGSTVTTVLYRDDAIDVTDRVIKAYDASRKK
jgi:outer membrane protein